MGSVYKITDGEKCYYGSTINPLNTRLQQHKKNNDCETKHMDKNNMTIQLVEEVEDKEQLKWRERYYIENNECINEQLPIQTHEEKKEYHKRYFEKYKEKYNDNLKEYQQKPYYCPCGVVINTSSKAKHIKTKKHLSICGE